MARLGPISRNNLVRNLRALGFEGPYSGKKHQFLIKGQTILRLPNPHQSDISKEFLARILKQAGITRATWENL